MLVNGTVSVSGAKPGRTCLVAALLPDSSLYCTNRALFACVCVFFHAGPFMYLQAQSRVCACFQCGWHLMFGAMLAQSLTSLSPSSSPLH